MRHAPSALFRVVSLFAVWFLVFGVGTDAPDSFAGTCTSIVFCNDCEWNDKRMTFDCDRVDTNGSCNCIAGASGCTEWDTCTYTGSGGGFPPY